MSADEDSMRWLNGVVCRIKMSGSMTWVRQKKGWKGFEDAEERLVTITEKDLEDRYD